MKTNWRMVYVALLAVAWMSIGRVTTLAAEPEKDPAILTLERIFESGEFGGEGPPALQWSRRRGGYTTWEASADKVPGRDLVWHDAATDGKEVLVPSHLLIPPGAESPLSIEGHSFSDDEGKLLIFTNSKRVWRTRSRGDYWVLDIAAGELKKLGGDVPPSSLMFATLSPDGSRVAYVYKHNLFSQDLRTREVTPLTADGSPQIINGTFDWVYEEELMLQNGFRWSPDSRSIAYWQINTEGVREMLLINNTDSLYAQVQAIPYPKVGEQNPAARIGVVGATGGETRWLAVPGDPREHYLSQLDWAGDSDEIVLQQFNRLQNTNRLLVAKAESGEVRTLLTETDAAWVENSNTHLRWFDDHKKLVWLSERDGWQHAYALTRGDGAVSRITSGNFDAVSVEAIDERDRWLYYMGSPDNPTQRYLFRARLDGSQSERLTPADQGGTHHYNISPDAKVAVHSYSTFDTPPVTELISLPDHKRLRVFSENTKLKETLAKLKRSPTEFFRVNIGDNVLLDAWCIKPPDFDATKIYPVLFHVYGEPAGCPPCCRNRKRHPCRETPRDRTSRDAHCRSRTPSRIFRGFGDMLESRP